MQRKLVKVSSAVLDLEPRQFSHEASLETGNPRVSGSDIKDSPLPPSPRVLMALNDYIAENSLDRYPDQEALELREKLARYTSLPKENISCFGGSDVALEHIARTYLEPGVEAVMACAGNADFRAIAQSTGAMIVDIHQDDPFDIQIESVINQIGPRTRLVYLSNPDNLTGAVFTEAEIVFLLAYAERALVVVDESYFEFSGQTVADLVRRFPNLIVVRSFSKAFGLASLRVGYILSDHGNLDFVNRLKITNNLSGPGRVAATAALEDLDFINQYINLINQSKKSLFESLPEIGYEFKITPANFFLIKVSDPEVAVQRLQAANFRVRDFSRFLELAGYLQITIGTPEETDKLLLSLSRLAYELSTGMNRISQQPAIERLSQRVEIGVGVR